MIILDIKDGFIHLDRIKEIADSNAKYLRDTHQSSIRIDVESPLAVPLYFGRVLDGVDALMNVPQLVPRQDFIHSIGNVVMMPGTIYQLRPSFNFTDLVKEGNYQKIGCMVSYWESFTPKMSDKYVISGFYLLSPEELEKVPSPFIQD